MSGLLCETLPDPDLTLRYLGVARRMLEYYVEQTGTRRVNLVTTIDDTGQVVIIPIVSGLGPYLGLMHEAYLSMDLDRVDRLMTALVMLGQDPEEIEAAALAIIEAAPHNVQQWWTGRCTCRDHLN